MTNCACRVSVAKCDKPKDVCLIFDGAAEFRGARFCAAYKQRRGNQGARPRRGVRLVHTSNNSGDRASVICSCCPCCCTILRGRTQLKHPHAFEPSRFEARINDAECTGCGICADERCPMKAVEMREGAAVVDTKECIGCGLCASGCPARAIEMIDRNAVPGVPATTRNGREGATGKGKA